MSSEGRSDAAQNVPDSKHGGYWREIVQIAGAYSEERKAHYRILEQVGEADWGVGRSCSHSHDGETEASSTARAFQRVDVTVKAFRVIKCTYIEAVAKLIVKETCMQDRGESNGKVLVARTKRQTRKCFK